MKKITIILLVLSVAARAQFIVNPYNFGSNVIATGGTITTSGDYTIHKFNSTGTLTVTKAGNIEVLVVAGGGGVGNFSGTSIYGGGGGAGGLLYAASIYVPVGTHTVTVGNGGLGYANGENSTFLSMTAYGGGQGGGVAGGSGGGGSTSYAAYNYLGGAATQTSNGGATGYGNGGATNMGSGSGGGGGAGGAGISTSGGAGRSYSITGSAVTYAAGGDGWTGAGANGTANTGNGANGGATISDKRGGKGVVIIKHK